MYLTANSRLAQAIYLPHRAGWPSGLVIIALAFLFSHKVMAEESIIQQRQHNFKAMGSAMKVMRKQLKSGDMDRAVMLQQSEKIAGYAPMIASWFPAGTGPDAAEQTDALAYIWKKPDKFSRLSQQLVEKSEALITAIKKGDVGLLKTQLVDLNNNCKTCHRSFRAD